MSRKGSAVLGLALTVVFAMFAAVAYAGSDHFFSGTMISGVGFASTEAHSITYIQGDADHNGFCVAKDQGITGYASSSRNVAGVRSCASSGGFVSRSENGSCCYHGWADNGTGSSIVFTSATRYDY